MLLAAVVAVVFASERYRSGTWRLRFFDSFDPPTRLEGRQQIRAAARVEAFRQIRGAPIARETRRQAAREIARTSTSPARNQ